jgi:4-hydroxy-4-methyl-2-oxoglutarate aldolase
VGNSLKDFERMDSKTLEGLSKFDAATVFEAGGRVGMVDQEIRALWPNARLCGTALTVECPHGDGLMIHKAVSIGQPGDVIVANTNNSVSFAVWGDILTMAAQSRGIRGAVIHGIVRDSAEIARLGFPVFCRGTGVRACTKALLGKINHPVTCGGILVNPGDIVVGDADGVVIVSKEHAQDVLYRAIELEKREREIKAKLQNGASTLEVFSYDEVLSRLGIP